MSATRPLHPRDRTCRARLVMSQKCHEPTCKEWCALQSVFEDFPVLHDDDEVLCRIFDELDVGDRVAVDEQDVSKCALLDHPELAGIRIAHEMPIHTSRTDVINERVSDSDSVPIYTCHTLPLAMAGFDLATGSHFHYAR